MSSAAFIVIIASCDASPANASRPPPSNFRYSAARAGLANDGAE